MYTYFLIPIFYLLYQLLWGYYCQFFILVALYPDISFFAFFGVCFCLSHTLCFMFSLLFSGRVPRHFILCFFRGTFLSSSYITVSYFPCFLVVAYPDISFFAFFGVHFRPSHTLCFIFPLLFSGRVPRYFIFNFFRGTFPSFSYIMFHIFLAF